LAPHGESLLWRLLTSHQARDQYEQRGKQGTGGYKHNSPPLQIANCKLQIAGLIFNLQFAIVKDPSAN
jgi:hypothetical protein